MSDQQNQQSASGQPEQGGDLPGTVAATGAAGGRRRSRILLPAAIAAAVAAGVVVAPALAASQDLPSVTAQQLLAKVLASHVQTFSGNVQATVDLGLPAGVTSLLPSSTPRVGSGATAAAPSQSALAQQQLLALVSGAKHTFQVAADGPDRQRLSSDDSGSAFTLVHNGGTAWAYDAQGNTATRLTGVGAGAAVTPAPDTSLSNPQQVAAQALKALGPSTTVSVAGTSRVAGQSVYELSLKPKESGSTISEVRIAVDAANGMPLQVRVNPADGSASILNVAFTSVSFAKPAASTFAFTPPSGTKVTEQAAPARGDHAPAADKKTEKGGLSGSATDKNVIGTGWTTIYSFPSSPGKGGAGSQLGSLKSLGKQVPGGTLISTKLVNILVTNGGTVYAGAVTPALLEQAAGK